MKPDHFTHQTTRWLVDVYDRRSKAHLFIERRSSATGDRFYRPSCNCSSGEYPSNHLSTDDGRARCAHCLSRSRKRAEDDQQYSQRLSSPVLGTATDLEAPTKYKILVGVAADLETAISTHTRDGWCREGPLIYCGSSWDTLEGLKYAQPHFAQMMGKHVNEATKE